ncbi:HD domain-containing protein [Myxococcota bacterium]|nr:HD domain-containing protein [Myxococcota bacterium]
MSSFPSPPLASSSPRLDALWRAVQPLLPTADLAHDRDHVLRVTAWARRLAPEAGADPELAVAAALVHDLVNIPKDSPDRPLGSEASAAASRGHLEAAGFTPAEVAQVVEAVRTCSWSRGHAPTGPLGRVLQDADRLDALGAVGLARNLACAQSFAARSPSRFYDPADPLGSSGRPLDDVRNAADHFFVKLQHLARGMHTATARAEAARRQAFMEAFLGRLAAEAEVAADLAD